MSFNRRGGDRRPDRERFDRAPRRGGGDWQPRERAEGERPYQQRDRDDRGPQPRPYQPRGGDRPYSPRPRFDRPPDEGAMSIRLDPRRLGTLKHLAGEAGVRPGDLVRQWVEERIDATRGGATAEPSGLAGRVEELAARVAALEAAAGAAAPATPDETTDAAPAPVEQTAGDGAAQTAEQPEHQAEEAPRSGASRSRNTISAAPRGERVALHDEMIAVLREHGPMTAAELAGAITERGRYTPPRSGKALDAAMVSQRVSNPTYRSRFTRTDGRISLSE